MKPLTGARPFNADRHPRGWHGRFSAGAGRSPSSHAMRGQGRPEPAAIKRVHAITPLPSEMHRRFSGTISVARGIPQGGE